MGIRKRLWQNTKADHARSTGFYHQRPPRSLDEKRPSPTPVSDGVKRHAQRIRDARAAYTKRLAMVPVNEPASRQVRRAAERRAGKMPCE
jgi:hypothetical protein